MRIGMVLQTAFPPDIRIEKEIRSLSRSHAIALLCSTPSDQPTKESWSGIDIYRLIRGRQRLRGQFSIMRNRFSLDWKNALEQFIREFSPDVLHVHDLPLVGTTLDVATAFEIPVVADLHENYPAMLQETKRIPLHEIRSLGRLVSRFTVSIKRWLEYEKATVQKCDQVIVVVEEAKSRLESLGLDPERIHVVGNYEETNGREPRTMEQAGGGSEEGFTLIYAGGFDTTRDLNTVVRACSLLSKQELPDLLIHLVGGKGAALTEVRDLAAKLGVEDRVATTGWVTQLEVESIVSRASVGLVPHVKSAHTDNTIPHKLFQYMWRKLPVIVSNCAPLERIVSESRCGLIYESGDAESLARAIREMYENRGTSLKMGENAHTAVAMKYNWDQAASVLSDVYTRLGKPNN